MAEIVGAFSEFALIDRIAAICGSTANAQVEIGIGDDAAVITNPPGLSTVLTTDALIETVHFKRSWIKPDDLGYRAIAVNASDIAAMGGVPICALVSLHLPGTLPVADLDSLFHGMHAAMQTFGGTVAGGNLARVPELLVVDITMVGHVRSGHTVRRRGARPGDRIYVTGTLGGAAAGRELLGRGDSVLITEFAHLVDRYRRPTARVAVGRVLAEKGLASAMIDISDGLAGDLSHICEQSRTGAVIHWTDLPAADSLSACADALGADPGEWMLSGGEDFELLFTTAPANGKAIAALEQSLEVPLTWIGEIVEESRGLTLLGRDNQSRQLTPRGWDHFAQ
ncbi:MAG TPA: thiamine-phosphate kinase [candidate division Zixibacteria bacterium]|nr:thiamine-phosphate kinase [candidate division Zixibacteria bacterium]